jgi:hypothetical protein
VSIKGKYDYLVVSKSGFTEECIRSMDENKILHLDLKEITKLFDEIS